MGRWRRRDRPLSDRAVGRLRDHHSAAARQRPLPPHEVLLPRYLASLAGGRPPLAAPPAGCGLEFLRPALAAPAPCALGGRGRTLLRVAAMGRPLGTPRGRRGPRIRRRALHE